MATLNEIFTEPATGLHYRIRPAQAGQGAAPCLVLLHGVGASEAGFVDLARAMDPRLAVVLVRGPLAFGPGRHGWFQVRFTPDGPVIDAAQAELARSTLLAFIGSLPALHGLDPRRIRIAGFSQGGIMSASVALTAPASVAGFGILSGRILPEIRPLLAPSSQLTDIPAFVSHGVQDETLGIHFGRQSRALLSELGVPLAYHEYEAGHALDAAMVRDFNDWLVAHIDADHAA